MSKGAAHQLFLKAFAKAKEKDKLSVSELARRAKISPTGLWYNCKGVRQWNADNWLAVMKELGATRIAKEKVVVTQND